MSDYQGNIIIKNPATPTGPNQNGSAPGVWKLSEALGFIRQGIWPTQGVGGPDVYFPYVSLLLSTTALGNASNNLFVDSSGAFNPIARSGNTTQGSATPYSANWSNYFDGTSDSLTYTGGTSLNFGTSDFTIELWAFLTNTGTYSPFIRPDDSGSFPEFGYDFSSGQLKFDARNAPIVAVTTTMPTNQWVHVAVSRSGTSLRLFVNGTQVGSTTTNSTNFGSTTGTIRIGGSSFSSSHTVNGYLSNFRVLKGTALYTANFTPPTSALTAITNTSLLTCQSNRFRDASTNNFTITSSGDVRVTDFAPFSPADPGIIYNQSNITNWSNYFDGDGDYLTVPSSSAFNYGTGDFTIECWGYRGSSSNFWCGYSASGVSFTLFSYSGASSTIQVYSSGFYDSGINPGYNTWFHVAVTRSSGTLRIFINGVQGFSGSYTTDIASHSVRIGASTANEWGLGNVSNLRVVKGTALYTSNFTPPTTNLTAVSGTSLLTCQSAAFTDNSTNNFVITPTGNTTVTGNSPFNAVGYWSNYFDGSSTITFNSISLAGDFTIEGWVYFIGTNNPTVLGANPPNNQSLRRLATGKHYFYRQGVDITGTIDVPLNQWVHLAATRSGGTVRIFTNGVLDGSRTINGTFSLFCLGGVDTGTDRLTGYTSNMRVVDGTAIYTATFTPPTAPLTAVSGTVLLTSQNGNFKDNSTSNLTLTINGSPSARSFDPFYTASIASNGGSMYFDGTNDGLTINNPNTAIGAISSSFTFETWVYWNETPPGNGSGAERQLIGQHNWPESSSGNWWAIFGVQAGIYFYAAGGGSYDLLTASFSWVKNTWYHVAVTRNGSSVTFYVNGVNIGTGTTSKVLIADNTRPLTVGADQGANVNVVNGYMADTRLTAGVVVYTSNFTPPTAPLTPSANTSLLINGMNAGIYDATAINDMETVGNAQVTTAVSKFGGSSVYFDGTGDYLTSNAASDLYAFGTGDFTVEMWFNLSSFANLQVLYDSRPTSTDGLYVCIFVPAGGASVNLQVSAATQITGTATLSTGVWYHLALSRSSGSTKMFLNGTQVGSTYADTNAYLNSGTTRPFIGGSSYSAGTLTVNGYIDEVRVTKGIARYTSNFTPPATAFTPF